MTRSTRIPIVLCFAGLLACCVAVFGQNKNGPPPASTQSATTSQDEAVEGEKRFRANCGRCHMPPHKLSPAAMKTAIRHMRVRAMLTDEDMRLIERFMTR